MKIQYILLLAFILLVSNQGHAQKDIDLTCWNLALEISEKNSCFIPAAASEKETVMSDKDEIVETTRKDYKLFINGQKKLDITLVQSLENGEDRLKKDQKDFLDQKEEYLDLNDDNNPFARASQKNIEFLSLEKTETDSIYSYHFTIDGITFLCKAWLDTKTGYPKKNQITKSRIKDEDTTLKNYKEISYYLEINGKWVKERIEQTMDIKAKVYLFKSFNGKIVSTVTLDNHFCYNKN